MVTRKHLINWPDFLWNIWCIFTVVGIWPRFIEPYILSVKRMMLPISNLPPSLEGLKILQFSDLHLHPRVPNFFLASLIKKINALKPDVIVFTGDFLCYSKIQETERLKNLLKSIKAPYGCYAILGNHDYEQFVSVNEKGEYDVLTKRSSSISLGLKRLFSSICLTKKMTKAASLVQLNKPLVELLKETPFELLHNTTKLIPIKGTYLNLCGLGEYILGRCQPEEAFKSYDRQYPGIVLSHNPDSVPLLINYPGDIILSGHTHGGQVNLPWMWKKFALMENPELLRGLTKTKNKWIYVNRGIGSVMPFRWFSIPEISFFELRKKK